MLLTSCLGLNTVPAQTDAHENHLLIAQQQQLQQLIDAQTIQHRSGIWKVIFKRSEE